MLPVCCLLLPGVIVKKLLGAGFEHAEDLFSSSNELNPEVEKMLKSYPEAKEIIIASLNPPQKISAKEVLQVEQGGKRILSFSYRLDKVLGGGVPLGQILEVCGSPGSGKTQLCLQLCISVQLLSCVGGLQSEAVYIDTDAGFSPQRMKEMAKGCREHCCRLARVKMFPSELISALENQSFTNYYYTPVTDYSQLLATVFSLDNFILKHNKVKLVIIDSLPFPFYPLKDMLKRTMLLTKIIQHLRKLAIQHNLSVVMTNHLTTRISRGEDQQHIPALGECVAHLINSQLLLGSLADGTYAGILYKSPFLTNNSAQFKITKDGIRDYT